MGTINTLVPVIKADLFGSELEKFKKIEIFSHNQNDLKA